MNGLVGAIFVGVTSFVATNIDDIVVLMVFFAQLNAKFRRRHVILGQYLGFCALLLASLPGYLSGLVISKSWLGLLGFLPITIGVSQLIQCSEDEPSIQDVSPEMNDLVGTTSVWSRLKTLLNPQTYTVAAVTIANGGDNIGIYVPLFANSSLPQLAVILGVFFLLVGVWCFVAERLARQKAIARRLTQYSHRIVPFVFVALGIYVLVESQTYQLLPFG
ncbi:MAG: transporter [Acaryochloridaceae cyanobacterium RU_4_10]|nr:transporter [Acaryochloridaceae cyanobacterium RU_4_10]